MIPKKIHYCWFGGKEMPDDLKKCIDSWKKYMPDYEIIRWDESNYDTNKCDYIKEAYDAKKWAFVSDYVRLDVCYTYGGIYLDTDVEVIKSFDNLLELKAFCGFEIGKKKQPNEVNTGLGFGMEKGFKLGRMFLEDYHLKHFKKSDGMYDMTPCPKIQTKILREKGLLLENKIQVIDGMTIFPTEYFCPMNQYNGKITITKNTYSIHRYFDSWDDVADKVRRNLRIKYSFMGNVLSNIISTIISYSKYYGFFGMWKEILRRFKNATSLK